jgi:hypothetical protein
MSANPALSSSAVEGLLFSTAVDLGDAGRDMLYGYGRVNASAAVQAAKASVSSVDTAAPTVSISAPLGSSTVSGLVPVNVNATDNVGVTKIELRVNGALMATDTLAPFAFSWNSLTVANGMANLVATVYDAAGNSSSSAPVAVNVANAVVADTQAPVVVISNPQDGSRVSGMVGVRVSVSDNGDLSGLRQTLYLDGQEVATASGGALSYNWNSRKASSGSHTLQVVARDAAGNSTTRSVTVSK